MKFQVIDISGKVLAGCTVIERVALNERNARWKLVAACGHVREMDGYYLRKMHREGHTVVCLRCGEKARNAAFLRANAARTAARRAAYEAKGLSRPKSQSKPPCELCADLNHRVQGARCRACKRPYREEKLERAS